MSRVQPSEFTAWVEPHLPAMSRYPARLVPVADRDDVVQEALVRAWRRHTTYDDRIGAPLPWLPAIVADRARRHRTRTRPTFELAAAPVEPVETDVDVERAVLQLSGRQRQAVDLQYFVGLDVATCAQVMGCAEGTVKATLHQARGRCACCWVMTSELRHERRPAGQAAPPGPERGGETTSRRRPPSRRLP